MVVGNMMYKIFKLELHKKEDSESSPGTIDTDNKNYLYIKTLDGWVVVHELQPEGKRRMNIQEFFRGNKL